MIELNDVYDALSSRHDVKGFAYEDIFYCAKTGYNFLKTNLKEGADNDTLALEVAVAVAHYNFFLQTLTEPEKFESYRAGDITINADPTKALLREKAVRDDIIAAASSILKDGGFYCCG